MKPSARQAIAALGPLYCPMEERINPGFDEIQKRCTAWVDEFRLYQDEGQRARLLSTGAGEIYARALPFAPAEKVGDVSKWLYWGFATDDMVYDAGPTSIDSAAFLAVAAQLVRIIEEPRSRFAGEFAYTDALRDLTTSILRHATSQQRIDWVTTARAWFFGMAWDSANAQRQTRPDLNDYLMMRMHTGGLASWLVTLGIAGGSELSADEAASPPLRAASEAWATMALLINDLMSFPKEIEQGQTSSNVVAVLMQAGNLEPGDAVHQAYVLVDTLSALLDRAHSKTAQVCQPGNGHLPRRDAALVARHHRLGLSVQPVYRCWRRAPSHRVPRLQGLAVPRPTRAAAIPRHQLVVGRSRRARLVSSLRTKETDWCSTLRPLSRALQ